MKAADELAKHVGVKPACAALEVSRSTLYRRRGPSTGQQQPRPTPARALSETERGEVFDTLCSERFVDRSPAEVVATLLDEEVYLCSERTMYRVLASEVPVQERRAQRTHPEYKKPELMATAPNQVWSWDITRLLGPKKWSYYYLYVIMDIYSRYVGNADQVIAGRKSVLREAWAAHPERFVRGVPKPKPLPEAVFINPPIPSLTTQDIAL